MKALIEQLAAVLERLCGLHTELCGIARRMNEALRRKDVTAVQKHTAAYDLQICEIEKLEEERLTLCDGIARQMNSPGRHLTVAVIMESAGEDERKRLQKSRTELKARIGELAGINTSNQVLLAETLNDIDVTMRIVAKAGDKFAGYGHQGTREQAGTAQRLINHVA